MKKGPVFLKKYFWDIDFKTLDLKKHAAEVIGRIMEYGDEKSVSWLLKHYSRPEMSHVLCHFRFVSPKSAGFWAIILKIPKGKILCLQKHFQKTQKKHWPY